MQGIGGPDPDQYSNAVRTTSDRGGRSRTPRPCDLRKTAHRRTAADRCSWLGVKGSQVHIPSARQSRSEAGRPWGGPPFCVSTATSTATRCKTATLTTRGPRRAGRRPHDAAPVRHGCTSGRPTERPSDSLVLLVHRRRTRGVPILTTAEAGGEQQPGERLEAVAAHMIEEPPGLGGAEMSWLPSSSGRSTHLSGACGGPGRGR
jgi:hypothetical protein